MNAYIALENILKKANKAADAGEFTKSELLFETYLDLKDSYKKLDNKLAAYTDKQHETRNEYK